MQTITPFLWFDNDAEAAVAFYRSVFPDTAVHDAGPGGPVSSLRFRLLNQDFIALNGGPHYRFTPAISMFVSCDTQADVDALWDKLLAGGGAPQRCGWLTDRYGLSWQVIPRGLDALLGSPDPARANRVMQAMLGMVRLDIAALQAAHDDA